METYFFLVILCRPPQRVFVYWWCLINISETGSLCPLRAHCPRSPGSSAQASASEPREGALSPGWPPGCSGSVEPEGHLATVPAWVCDRPAHSQSGPRRAGPLHLRAELGGTRVLWDSFLCGALRSQPLPRSSRTQLTCPGSVAQSSPTVDTSHCSPHPPPAL